MTTRRADAGRLRKPPPIGLTRSDVANIRALLAVRAKAMRDVRVLSIPKLAEKFDVPESVIRRIGDRDGYTT